MIWRPSDHVKDGDDERTPVSECTDKQHATWRDTAVEWAEETIEHGPSAYILPATAEALAQTVLALNAAPRAAGKVLARPVEVPVPAEAAHSGDSDGRSAFVDLMNRLAPHRVIGDVDTYTTAQMALAFRAGQAAPSSATRF